MEREIDAIREALRAVRLSWAVAALMAAAPAVHAEYEDRLIDPNDLPALSDEESGRPYNPEGLPRSWRLEGFGSYIDQGGRTRRENGLVMSTRLDTLEHGAYTLDATLRPHGSVATLWQRGLAFDDGWRANNAIGMVNTPAIDLSRQQYRFFLPTFPIVGVQTEWLHQNDFQVQASIGQPGIYTGVRLAGFSQLGGTLSTLGMQWTVDPLWVAGVYVADARDVQSPGQSADPPVTARSVYAVLARQEGRSRMQFNLLDSDMKGGERHQYGLWFDAESYGARLRHNYGAFRFDPEVTWAHVPVNRDLQGAYYRVSYQSQRLIWAAGVDSISSVTGRGTEATYASGSIRLQLDTRMGVGGGVNARHSSQDAASAYAFLDRQSLFGTTRVQVDVLGAQGGQRGEQLTLDQSWPTQVGLRITTSLAASRERTVEKPPSTRLSLAIFGGADLTNSLSVEGTVRLSREREAARTAGRYANVGLVWRVAPRWSLVASYYDNRSDVQPFATLAPPIPIVTPPEVARDRAIFITVRYEDHAGTPIAPLGGMPGAGAGRISGSVFYDANDDGRREASERGAANVTVILDGRFAVRTDSEGRFEFPLVASGTHSITVVPDNLALPYAIPGDGRREVVVRTRETTPLEIAATRLP